MSVPLPGEQRGRGSGQSRVPGPQSWLWFLPEVALAHLLESASSPTPGRFFFLFFSFLEGRKQANHRAPLLLSEARGPGRAGEQRFGEFFCRRRDGCRRIDPPEDESHRDAQRKPLWSEQADNVPDRTSTPCQFVVIGGGKHKWGRARGCHRGVTMEAQERRMEVDRKGDPETEAQRLRDMQMEGC